VSDTLVADPEAPGWSDGSSLLGDASGLFTDISQGDVLDGVFDGGSAALDILGDALDPFGAAIGCAVGWVVEHVSFLREAVDDLAGDPASIEAASTTWGNVSTALGQAGTDYSAALSKLTADDWEGAAADAYRDKAVGMINVLGSSSSAAIAESLVITATGTLCAWFRSQIFTWVSDFIGDMLLRGLIALANSWWSFGASIAAWVLDVITEGGLLAAKITAKMASLTAKAAKICEKFAHDGNKFEQAAKKLREVEKQLNKDAKEIKEAANAAKGLKNDSTKFRESAAKMQKAAGEAGEHIHLGDVDSTVGNTKDALNYLMDPSVENLNTLADDAGEFATDKIPDGSDPAPAATGSGPANGHH
jgi:hypothetical protein